MNRSLELIREKLNSNYDIIYRDLEVKNTQLTIVYNFNISDVDDINKNIISPIIKTDKALTFEELANKNRIITNDAEIINDLSKAIIYVLSGYVLVFYDKNKQIIAYDTKSKLNRQIRIPPTEAVNKGPREGFNEGLKDNISLIRSRLINPNLKLEKFIVGKETKTTVVMAYINGTAPTHLVKYVKDNIRCNDIKFILDSNYIAKGFEKKATIFDTVGYTEKPDKVVSDLLQGKVSVMVDGSPFAIIMPYFFLENFQTSDDYYLNKYVVTISRLIKYFAFIIGLLLPPVYLSLVSFHFSFIPLKFLFRLASSRAGVPIPTYLELYLMLFFFYLAKEASIRLPKNIGSSLSIVAGLVLGQTTVEAGIASQITVVIAGIYAISTFVNSKIATPMYFWTSIMIILATLIGFPGLIMGTMGCLAHLASLDSCGYPFLFPVGTKKNYHMKDIIWMNDVEEMSEPLINEGDQI